MSPIERQARFLLGAYPPAWRESRGEEMLGTILDHAGDRPRLSARVAAALAIGGWRERSCHHVASVGQPAAGWLLPFFALDHLAWGGSAGIVTGTVVAFLVVAYAIRSGGLHRSGGGDHLQA